VAGEKLKDRRISPPKIGLVTILMLRSVIFFTAIFSVIGIFIYNYQKSFLIENIHEKNHLLVETYAEFISDAKENFEDLVIVDYLSRLKRFPTVRYAIVLDNQARVLFHTDMREVGKTYDDEASLKAIASKEGVLQEIFFEGQNLLDYSAPIEVEHKKVATLRVGFSKANILAGLDEIRENLMVVFIVGIVIVLVGSFILNSGIGVGISKIKQAINDVARGELPDEIDYKGAGEIGYLARILERLFGKVREMQAQGEKEKIQIKKSSEFFIQNICEILSDGVIVLDGENKIVYTNEIAGKIAGFSPLGCIGKHMLEIIRNAELMEFLNYASQKPNVLNEKEIFSLNCFASIKVVKDIDTGVQLGTIISLKKTE